ncbi:MAG: glucosaminidase domain-containing protein [Clostridium sp.]|uniref:glucosaminidase domain-containing protein n=1 Tax=Clostridium sp. TaxID=1506 RepID=UPI002FC6BC11
MRKLYITFGSLLICIGVALFLFYDSGIYRMNLSKETKALYKKVVNEVSSGKVQVNYREVIAADGAINYGSVDSSTESSIRKIAERFIVEGERGKYKTRSLSEVVKSLGGKGDETDSAKKYLKILNKQYKLNKDYKEDFVSEIEDKVLEVSEKTGILPSVIMGQAILESNWGRSKLSDKYNNLFGIKAQNGYTGKKVNLKTSENYKETINDDFRVYDDFEESLDDYGEFMVKNPRYKKAGVFSEKTYYNQVKAIENAGYSTIKNESGEAVYAQYVANIIYQNDLEILDTLIEK